jgi:CelD/BcsL family acetyltransferase involved in cellulose biosynthesis
MQSELIEDRARLEDLGEEWRELLGESDADCLFLTWEWLSTWWRHLSRSRRLRVFTLRSGGQLMAVLPLAEQRWPALPFVHSLEFLGSGDVGSDYLDAIVRRGAEREVAHSLVEGLCASRQLLRLRRVSAGSTAIMMARDLAARGWGVRTARTDVCPVIPLSGHTWESYLNTLGSSHRYNVRRRTRQLGQAFEVHFEPVRAEADRPAALHTLMQLHGRRWERRGGSTAFHHRALTAFHEDFSRIALARGWLRLYVLRLNGEPAAALYGFLYRGTFYYYQAGFDPRYQRHSVGLVTMGLSIGEALRESARAFDMLHGDESYKFLWAREVRAVTSFELFPPGTTGAWCQLAGRVYRTAATLARRAVGRPHPDTRHDVQPEAWLPSSR